MPQTQPTSSRFTLRLLLALWAFVALFAHPDTALSAPSVSLAALPATMIAADDATLACKTAGHGPPLLLLTGYACSMDGWDADLVGALAAEHTVIACDYRGVGESTSGAAPFTLRRFADDAASALTSLGVGKADVLGWSMGAATAVEMALAHPDRVDKAVLIGAPFSSDVVASAVDRMAAMSRREFRESLFPPSWVTAHPDAYDRLPRTVPPVSAATIGRQREALVTWSGFAGRVGACRTPIFLVVGDADWVTPPSESEALAKLLPRGCLIRIKDAGHWLPYQDPAVLTRMVNHFLDAPRPCVP